METKRKIEEYLARLLVCFRNSEWFPFLQSLQGRFRLFKNWFHVLQTDVAPAITFDIFLLRKYQLKFSLFNDKGSRVVKSPERGLVKDRLNLSDVTDEGVLDTFKKSFELRTSWRYVSVEQADSTGLKSDLK